MCEELGRTDVVKNKMYTDSIPPRRQPCQMMLQERTGPVSEASAQEGPTIHETMMFSYCFGNKKLWESYITITITLPSITITITFCHHFRRDNKLYCYHIFSIYIL